MRTILPNSAPTTPSSKQTGRRNHTWLAVLPFPPSFIYFASPSAILISWTNFNYHFFTSTCDYYSFHFLPPPGHHHRRATNITHCFSTHLHLLTVLHITAARCQRTNGLLVRRMVLATGMSTSGRLITFTRRPSLNVWWSSPLPSEINMDTSPDVEAQASQQVAVSCSSATGASSSAPPLTSSVVPPLQTNTPTGQASFSMGYFIMYEEELCLDIDTALNSDFMQSSIDRIKEFIQNVEDILD